ncbi:T-complex protein 11-domain-containing protein [Xylariaceae sp. FL0255]|nr:T-complex protein 11-domain-containing protein [Xylariaceae sp. FL0255]
MADEESGIASHGISPNSARSLSDIIPNQPQDPKNDVQRITRETLSELDANNIIKNSKLRHDLNFDPQLHFRPNTDGKKGEKKKTQADRFWKILQCQLQAFLADRDRFVGGHGNDNDWLLPMFLKSAKDILYTLVPKQDYIALEEGFNVDLIMQQISIGSVYLEKLASWLSGLFKMCDQLMNGSRTDDMGKVVQGLRGFLEILEVMRLDNTVRFEKHWFLEKIREHQFDPASAYAWYVELRLVIELASLRAFGDMAIFMEEFVSMVMLLYMQKYPILPDTFYFDKEKIERLCMDMLDAIYFKISSTNLISSASLAMSVSDALEFLSAATKSRELYDLLAALVRSEATKPGDYMEQMFCKRLLAVLKQRVKEFKRLTKTALFSAAIGYQLQRPYLTGLDAQNRIYRERPTLRTREEGGVSNISICLTHLGLLHWRM